MAATARNPRLSFESMALKPPLHPTYDLKEIIKLALAEDAGGQGYLIFFSISFSFLLLIILTNQFLYIWPYFVLLSQGRVLLYSFFFKHRKAPASSISH